MGRGEREEGGGGVRIGFRGKKFDIFREHVLCTSIVPPGWLIP